MPTLKILIDGRVCFDEYYHRSQAEKLADGLLHHWPQLSKLGRVAIVAEHGNFTQLLCWDDTKGKQNHAVNCAD